MYLALEVNYMTLLPNGVLYVTEIAKEGPHNTQIIFKSDSKRLDPQNTYSHWSVKLATFFSVTGGFGSAIHIEYVPELGW